MILLINYGSVHTNGMLLKKMKNKELKKLVKLNFFPPENFLKKP